MEREYLKRVHSDHSSHVDIETVGQSDASVTTDDDDTLLDDHDVVLSKFQRALNWFIFIVGLAAMIYGTVSSIQAIVDAFEKGDISPDPKPSSDGKYFTCYD